MSRQNEYPPCTWRPLRIPRPYLGKGTGNRETKSDRSQTRINLRQYDVPDGGEIRDVPPDPTEFGRGQGKVQGWRPGCNSQTQARESIKANKPSDQPCCTPPSRQGWGWVPAWRVLVEVRVVGPLRIPRPYLGEGPGIRDTRSDRSQTKINPRQFHDPDGGEIRDVPPDQTTDDNPLKGRTGDTTRTRSQNAAHRHRSMGA